MKTQNVSSKFPVSSSESESSEHGTRNSELLKILHLEDDPADARVIQDTLRQKGLEAQITVVPDCTQYLAAIQSGGYDLLLADYRLPGFDGLEALTHWRAKWPAKPFIFVTGSMGEDLAVQSLKRGATDYILKGNLARLLPAIHRAMDEAETQLRRQQAEAALRKREEHFRNMADHSPFMVWLSHRDKQTLWANQSWLHFVGRTLEQEQGSPWAQHVHPEDLARTLATHQTAYDTRTPYRMEYRLRRHDGQWRWIHDHGAPLFSPDQQLTAYIGSCIDLTDQKQTQETLKTALLEKEVLLREVHHRVKNNLQVISSLVSLQADGTTDTILRAMFQDVRDRVRTMALVHEKLYESEGLSLVDFGEYTRSLLDQILRAHAGAADRVKLHLDLEPVTLTMDQAVPCGLLLNELTSNAIKHAFLRVSHADAPSRKSERGEARGEREEWRSENRLAPRTRGELSVYLRQHDDGTVELRVRDNGAGLPPDLDWRKTASLGLRLVQMLGSQLNAAIETSNQGGAQFQIRFRNQTITKPQEGEENDEARTGSALAPLTS